MISGTYCPTCAALGSCYTQRKVNKHVETFSSANLERQTISSILSLLHRLSSKCSFFFASLYTCAFAYKRSISTSCSSTSILRNAIKMFCAQSPPMYSSSLPAPLPLLLTTGEKLQHPRSRAPSLGHLSLTVPTSAPFRAPGVR
jgi:hypothetical protein